jgi:hypothetical protein
MQALGSGRQNLGVKVTRYNKQFGNKRSDVVKGCKIFHAKQTKLAFQSLDEEFHVAPEMIIITGIPTGGVHTVMSPGLREDPKIREVASILDEAVQHRMEINRKAAKARILAGKEPEFPAGWGSTVEGEEGVPLRKVSVFSKLQEGVIRFHNQTLLPKAAAAQDEALKGKVLCKDRTATIL